mmetsp:Transcript_56790/g.138202  ORF Transcript_56790/g.138202 Transcript_56790/m.138202 type:complete len:298 (+) Transcript_56790:546-1439(+)
MSSSSLSSWFSSSSPPPPPRPPRSQNSPNSPSQHIQTQHNRLVWLYQVLTALCIMMVGWILVAPGSMWHGRTKFHDETITPMLNLSHDSLVPIDIVQKYVGHTAVHLTHVFPAAIWSAAIPFQFHKGFRKTRPTLHRRMGYAFFASSLLMAVGVVVIIRRKLMFESFYDDLPPPSALSSSIPTEVVLYAMNLYFVGTAATAWKKAAIDKSFGEHQDWMIRHVASGMWVGIQRVLLAFIYIPMYKPPVPREIQRESFGQAGQIGWFVSVAAGEYAIYLIHRNNKTINTKNTAVKAKAS